MNTSTNRDFQWDEKTSKEWAEYFFNERLKWGLLHCGEAAPVPIDLLIERFKSSRLSNGVEKESKYVAESIGKDRMDIHKSPNAEWPEVLSLMIEDLSSQKNVGVDWEILEYKIDDGVWGKKYKDGITKCFTDDEFVWARIYGAGYIVNDNMVKRKDAAIHSVRRLSDNSTWTVGDEVAHKINNEKLFVIKRFEIRGRKMLVFHPDKEDFFSFLENLKKPGKQVPPKVYYEIDTSTWDIIKTEFLHFPHYFDSEEKANDYVLMNKPVLSVNDVKSMYADDRSFVGTQWLIEKLKDFAKSKINP